MECIGKSIETMVDMVDMEDIKDMVDRKGTVDE